MINKINWLIDAMAANTERSLDNANNIKLIIIYMALIQPNYHVNLLLDLFNFVMIHQH